MSFETEIADAVRKVGGNETIIDIAREAGVEGQGDKLRIEMAKRPPEKLREESPPRDHRLTDPTDMVGYIRKYGGENTVVFLNTSTQPLDQPQIVAECVLDESADKGRELLTLLAEPSEEFQDFLLPMLDKPMLATAFALHVSKFRRRVVEPDGMTLTQMFSQIRVAKGISIDRGIGKKAVNGLVTEVAINGKVCNESVEIPDTIKVKFPLLVNTDEVEIEIDLLVDYNSDLDAVLVYCTSAGLQDAVAAARQQWHEQIIAETSNLDSHTLVVRGNARYGNWDYRQVRHGE